MVGTIIQKGRVSRPIIGITFLESARANTVGIQKGVLVLDVAENTSAASSGLRPTTSTRVIFFLFRYKQKRTFVPPVYLHRMRSFCCALRSEVL